MLVHSMIGPDSTRAGHDSTRTRPVPGSLKVDWEPIDGASYEVHWASTSDIAMVIGSATSASASDYIVSGLAPGTQYWMRVRPIRGGVTEMWSDPVTRVAPV